MVEIMIVCLSVCSFCILAALISSTFNSQHKNVKNIKTQKKTQKITNAKSYGFEIVLKIKQKSIFSFEYNIAWGFEFHTSILFNCEKSFILMAASNSNIIQR